MRRRVRATGWVLLALAVIVVTVIVTVGAVNARGSTVAFDRWVGWAAIAGLPVAAVGVLLALWDKIAGAAGVHGDLAVAEDELAAVVLAQAQAARSRLIGAGEPGDHAANVRFTRGTGRFGEAGGASVGDLASVLEYYRSLSPGRLVVLGEPGSGKTVLVMELLVGLLEAHRDGAGGPVPVLISAAAYDVRRSWDDWLAGHLALRFGLGAKAAARLVRDGRIVPVVDGLDEMDPAGRPGRAAALVAALNVAMRGRARAPVVVTCRHGEYQDLARAIGRATHVEMLPLSGDEAAGYLQDQLGSQDEQRRWAPVLASLQASPGGPLAGQLATPWRLTLALTAFYDDGDPASLLPPAPPMADRAAQEYAERVDRLLLSRYVPAAVRLHDPGERYPEPDVQRWLTALADGLAWQARRDGSATDIRLDQWQPAEGSTWLVHRVVVAVPALAGLIASVVTHHLALAVLAAGLALLIAAAGSESRGIRRLAVPLIFLVMAKLGGMLNGRLSLPDLSSHPREIGPAIGVLLVGVFGLAAGIAASAPIGLSYRSPQALSPRDVIRADGRYGLAAGLAAGLVLGLATGLVLGLAAGITVGLTAGLAAGIAAGLMLSGGAWTHYHITVVIIRIRRHGPLRFGGVPGLGAAGRAAARFRRRLPVPAPPDPGLAHIPRYPIPVATASATPSSPPREHQIRWK